MTTATITAATAATSTTTAGTTTDPAASDHGKIDARRDWRQIASEAVALTAALTGATAAGGLAFNVLVEVSKTLAVLTAALAGVLVWLLAETYREGRRWTYAHSDEPANTP